MGGRFNVSGYEINKFTSCKSLPLIRCNVMIYLVLFYLSFARQKINKEIRNHSIIILIGTAILSCLIPY